MERGDSPLSLRKQCELLGIHRSLIYYQPAQEREENLLLMRIIDELHLLEPSLGYRRIHALLRRMGYEVNPKRVYRLMRKMGIQAYYPRPKTSKKHAEHQIFPYLLSNLKIDRPD